MENYQTSVTVILNLWKRNYLREQLDALNAQTVLPNSIWIVHYEDHIPLDEEISNEIPIEYFGISVNLKYFGRFSIASFVKTKYVWILDDDVVPSPLWIEKCVDICNKKNAIVCSNGRIIPQGNYRPEGEIWKDYSSEHFVGDARSPYGYNRCLQDSRVDYGCSSYFFQTEWLCHFWSYWPKTFETGEDMHLSATLAKVNIITIVPEQLSREESGNISPEYSSDAHASWKMPGFVNQRESVLRDLIRNVPWKPIYWSSKS